MKKILFSLSSLTILGLFILGTTIAYFTSEVSSQANQFLAGEIELTIEDITHDGSGEFSKENLSFILSDLKPLDSGEITYTLKNGSNEAYLCVRVDNTTDNPKDSDLALAERLNFRYGSDSGLISSIAGVWQSLGLINADASGPYSVGYCFGVYENGDCVLADIDYNPAQKGQMIADLDFYAVQKKNNPNFDCDILNQEDLELPTIGAQLADYSPPSECDLTVDGDTHTTIQSALGIAGVNSIICVANGEYQENIETTANGQTIVAINPQGATINGGVRLSHEGSILQGFVVTGTTDTSGIGGDGYAVYASNNNVQILNNEINSGFGLIANSQGILTNIGSENILISKNTVSGFNTGIFMNPTTNSTVSYNSLNGNNVGVANDGPQNNTVSRNVFSGNFLESLGYNGSADSGTGNNGALTVEENNFSGGSIAQYGTIQLIINDNWLNDDVVLFYDVVNQAPLAIPYPTYQALKTYPASQAYL